jgi:hypothetical protein
MFDNKAEISFVEVVCHFYEPGDKEFKDFFETELELFDINIDEYGKNIIEVVEAKSRDKGFDLKGYEPDFLITKSFVGFKFSYFGQNFDACYSSGLAYEEHNMGPSYVFKNYKDELEEMARNLFDKFKIRKLQDNWNGNVVRFVTLWSYLSWQDSYYKEWDSEWELLGLVEPSKNLVQTPPLPN